MKKRTQLFEFMNERGGGGIQTPLISPRVSMNGKGMYGVHTYVHIVTLEMYLIVPCITACMYYNACYNVEQ